MVDGVELHHIVWLLMFQAFLCVGIYSYGYDRGLQRGREIWKDGYAEEIKAIYKNGV